MDEAELICYYHDDETISCRRSTERPLTVWFHVRFGVVLRFGAFILGSASVANLIGPSKSSSNHWKNIDPKSHLRFWVRKTSKIMNNINGYSMIVQWLFNDSSMGFQWLFDDYSEMCFRTNDFSMINWWWLFGSMVFQWLSGDLGFPKSWSCLPD